MTRFALILEASTVVPTDPIHGCKLDAARLEAWLKSPHGGAWNDDEVKVVNNVWLHEIEEHKPKLDAAHFSILAFSGHGRIIKTGGKSRQVITVGKIGGSTEIDFSILLPKSPKAIILCDACRIVYEAVKRYQRVAKAMVFNEKTATHFSREAYRRMYDEAIRNAVKGHFTMYSCSPDEYAGEETLEGGYFTQTLIDVSGLPPLPGRRAQRPSRSS